MSSNSDRRPGPRPSRPSPARPPSAKETRPGGPVQKMVPPKSSIIEKGGKQPPNPPPAPAAQARPPKPPKGSGKAKG